MGIAVVALAVAVGVAAVIQFSDDFSSYVQNVCFPDGASFGSWTVVFAGFGCVEVESDGVNAWLHSQPKAPKGGNTHSALVAGPLFSSATTTLTYDVKVHTIQQLRTKMNPRPWEVGWVVWHYTDNDHFYYFIAKTNGWELGKRDPAYKGGQRFLATGTSPTFPIGQQYAMRIIQDSTNTMTASVNGQLLVTFTDIERPYTGGKIGLYTEDAHVHFDDVFVDTNSNKYP